MLNDTQKEQCRVYLGYPSGFRYKNTRLESMLLSLSPEADIMIADILTNIATVDTALLKAGVTAAGIKRVDEIWFFGAYVTSNEVRRTGRTYVGRLSIILGCPIYSDYFSGKGYEGDSFSSGGTGRTRYGGYGLG